MKRALLLALALELSPIALARAQGTPASAESVARSRDLFERGRALAGAGDFAAACPLLQEANDLNRTNGTALQLANCYEQTGQIERAGVLYRSIVEAGDSKYPERVELAKTRLAEIEKQKERPPPVPSSTVSAAPPPPLAPTAASPTTERPAPPADSAPASRTPAFVAFGVGAAGVAVGAIFGVLALSQAGSVEDSCPDGRCPDDAERDRQIAEQDAARTKGWVSTVGFGVGVVGLAAGAVLLAVTGSSGGRAQAGRHGVTVRF